MQAFNKNKYILHGHLLTAISNLPLDLYYSRVSNKQGVFSEQGKRVKSFKIKNEKKTSLER